MTDREEFRKEVEKLKSNLIYGACSSQIAMETRCKEEAYNEVLSILNTMQEEPVRKVWHYANEHPEIEKPILLRKVNGVVELAICHDENFYPEIGEIWAYIDDILNLSNVERTGKNRKEPVSEELEKVVEEIVDSTVLNAYGVKEIANRLRNTICGISISEDLGEYINELSKQFPEVSFAKLSRIAVRVAKWQKQKDDGEIKMVRELLADFDKHCDEYHEAGFKHGQEALIKDAIDVEVKVEAGGYPYIPQMELYDYDKDVPLAKAGDRYKVILIKES